MNKWLQAKSWKISSYNKVKLNLLNIYTDIYVNILNKNIVGKRFQRERERESISTLLHYQTWQKNIWSRMMSSGWPFPIANSKSWKSGETFYLVIHIVLQQGATTHVPGLIKIIWKRRGYCLKYSRRVWRGSVSTLKFTSSVFLTLDALTVTCLLLKLLSGSIFKQPIDSFSFCFWYVSPFWCWVNSM